MTIACYQGMLNATDISLFETQMEIAEITDKELLRGPSGGQTQIELQSAINTQEDEHVINTGSFQFAPHVQAAGGSIIGGAGPLAGPTFATPPAVPVGAAQQIRLPDGRVVEVPAVPAGTTTQPQWRMYNRQTRQWVDAGTIPGAGQNVRFDRNQGCFVDDRGNIMFQELNIPGRGVVRVSGTRQALPKQQAINELKQKEAAEKREELQDKLRMNRLTTKMEMLNKQREKVMQWLTKAIEAWFKGPGDRN